VVGLDRTNRRLNDTTWYTAPPGQGLNLFIFVNYRAIYQGNVGKLRNIFNSSTFIRRYAGTQRCITYFALIEVVSRILRPIVHICISTYLPTYLCEYYLEWHFNPSWKKRTLLFPAKGGYKQIAYQNRHFSSSGLEVNPSWRIFVYSSEFFNQAPASPLII
jgi:hypothetical protein